MKTATEEKYVLELTDWERRFLVGCLVEQRNNFLDKDRPIEDICDIIETVIEAPTKKEKKKAVREAR